MVRVIEEDSPGPRLRPRVLNGHSHRRRTGCGNIYVTITGDEYGLMEVFSALGKAGGCAAAQTEAICRLASLCLRSGVDPQEVAGQLLGIQCPSPMLHPANEGCLSCPDAIARSITQELQGE